MRPTDENQHGSTRPNLLSGARRRIVEDDNLLARLERDSARHASGNRSRAAWYAAAASLVLLMIVVVGYMAYENANTVRLFPVAQTSVAGSGAVDIKRQGETAAALLPLALRTEEHGQAPLQDQPRNPTHVPPSGQEEGHRPVPVPAPVQTQAQAQAQAPRLESAPQSAATRASTGLPPLVLLQAHEVGSGKPVTPPRLAQSTSSAAPAPGKPLFRDGLPAAPAVAAVAAARSAPHIAPRIASRPVAPARARKPASGKAVGDDPVDTDVALLSAIIIHASSHADERAQLESTAACARAAEKHCAGRPAARP